MHPIQYRLTVLSVVEVFILLVAVGLSITTLRVHNRVMASALEGLSRLLWTFLFMVLLFAISPLVRKIHQEFGLTLPPLSLLLEHAGNTLVQWWPLTLVLIYGIDFMNMLGFIVLCAHHKLRLAKILSAVVSCMWLIGAIIIAIGLAMPLRQLTGLL